MRHYGRLAILALALAGAAPGAQELGTITFPTSGSPPRSRRSSTASRPSTASSSTRRPRRSARRRRPTRLCPRVLGRGDELQPSALGAAGSSRPPRGAREARADADGARREGAAAEGEGLPRGARPAVLRARRQAGARQRVLGGDGRACTRSGPTITRSRCSMRCRCSARCGPATRASAGRRWPRRSPSRCSSENPKHPGAAHFIIHAFDDPDHAPLGLPAARAYAKIAPSAAHALHMPSHIFVQLGMWDDVVASNIDAYKAAIDLNARMKLPEGREDFHTLVVARLRAT